MSKRTTRTRSKGEAKPHAKGQDAPASFTWQGNKGNDWCAGGNWQGGTAPRATGEAVFDDQDKQETAK